MAWLKSLALDRNDVALAKLAHRWEGDLLGDAPTNADVADVIDLGEARRAVRPAD